MPQNDITFIRTQGGLGRPLAGEDHLSAMAFYTAGSLPSGFASDDRIKKIFSLPEAESLGILDDHADETVATGGQVTITGTWIIGEIVRIEIDGGSLGQFVLTATTITSLVAGLVTAINANTNSGIRHGWVATDADPIITLVQPAKLGVTNDSGTPIVFVDRNAADTAGSAGGSSTDVQMSGGVGSYNAIEHYHISEFFRLQPDGVLTVGIFTQGTYDGTEVKTITDFADGLIRQTAVYVSHETFTSGQLTATQGILDTLHDDHKPQSVIFHADISSATLSTLANISLLSEERVTTVIGEDGDWHQGAYSDTKAYLPGNKATFQGAAYIAKTRTTGNPPWDGKNWTFISFALNTINGFSIGTTGVTLGTVSLSAVNENIGWAGKFNLVTGTGLQEPAFATGDLWKDQSNTLLDQLEDFHYVYLRKHFGSQGTFHSDSHTAIASSDDFATIENNRTIDKAERNIRTNNIPNLNRPLFVDPTTGFLSEDTIEVFKTASEDALIQMQSDSEISGTDDNPGFLVSINPEQKVLSTSEIKIGVVIVPTGTARQISFDIGLKPKILTATT